MPQECFPASTASRPRQNTATLVAESSRTAAFAAGTCAALRLAPRPRRKHTGLFFETWICHMTLRSTQTKLHAARASCSHASGRFRIRTRCFRRRHSPLETLGQSQRVQLVPLRASELTRATWVLSDLHHTKSARMRASRDMARLVQIALPMTHPLLPNFSMPQISVAPSGCGPSPESVRAANEDLRLLVVDASALGSEERAKFWPSDGEIRDWYVQAAGQGASLVVLRTVHTIELYTTRRDRDLACTRPLQDLAAGFQEHQAHSRVRRCCEGLPL